MIFAGKIEDISWTSGAWIFLDVGFSNKRRSCGLLFHDMEPKAFQFNTACVLIVERIADTTEPVNLTIEAPLSVAFDRSGNPCGRSIEKQGAKTRYWYNGLGCGVMVAAMYIVRAIHDACPRQEIRLFEGFVSYKDPDVRSEHLHDALLMRQVVKEQHPASIIAPNKLKTETSDQLKSAFWVAGLNCGVPPIIKCDV